METTPTQAAILTIASAGRATADLAYGIVADINQPTDTVTRLKQWRDVRWAALAALDAATLYELLNGATWEAVAAGYGRTVEEMRARFEPTLEVWRTGDLPAPHPGSNGEFTVGIARDEDPIGAAASHDTWVARHKEPWAEDTGYPVTEALMRA